MMRRVIALDPMIDTALGEASDLRYRSRILQAGVGGLITTISAWRTMALHLGAEPRTEDDDAVGAVEAILQRLATTPEDAARDAPGLRDASDAAARAAVRIEARSPASQLLATAAAAGAIGAARAFNGLTLIVDPRRTRREDALGPASPARLAAADHRRLEGLRDGGPRLAHLGRDRVVERPARHHVCDHRRCPFPPAGRPRLRRGVDLSLRLRSERRHCRDPDVRRPASGLHVSRSLPHARRRASFRSAF